jgi:putative ABC transport system substrate-binding protein
LRQSGAAAWPIAARGQQPGGRVWRIGFFGYTPPTPAMVSTLRDSLRERGYLEGQNPSIDVGWLVDQNPKVATELVSSGVDLIVAWTTLAAIAASRATATIPIVMLSVADPLGSRLVPELARPGGNITGVSNMAPELSGKIVQLLIEIVANLKRVGVVRNPNNPSNTASLRETAEAIRALSLQIEAVDAEAADDFDNALERLNARGVEGVVLLSDPVMIAHKERIAELAQKTRLRTIFQRQENVEAGGLLSYGSILNDQVRQAAFFVDRILKDARPGEMPVEQPAKFVLAINLKTAKALGLTVPPTLIARAEEVIE